MHTTNTASRGTSNTYSQIRTECEKLLRIAKEMEQIALADNGFPGNSKFSNLAVAFHSHLTDISGLSN